MKLFLNNNENAERLVTFNGCPTILTVDGEADNTSATKASMTITFKGSQQYLTNPIDGDYYIIINDVKIWGTDNIEKSGNNTFYYTSLVNYQSNMTMGYFLTKALNNTSLSNIYDIYTDRQKDGQGYETDYVHIVAKNYGSIYNITNVSTNLPSDSFSYTVTEATNNDELTNTKIICQLYIENDESVQDAIKSDTHKKHPFATELTKTYYKDSVSFDLSPILSNYTENNKIIEYNAVITSLGKESMKYIGELSHNYAVNGYDSVNGSKYLDMSNSVGEYAMNVNNGADIGYYNHTLLYYYDSIRFSILASSLEPFQVKYKYFGSDGLLLGEEIETVSHSTQLFTISKDINTLAYYVEVQVDDIGVLRFDNIKPMNYGDNNKYETLFFNNSYGGVSFFTFTASYDEEFDVDIEQYRKNVFDTYKTNEQGYTRTYSVSTETSVTLKSHYMVEDGLWTLRNMQNSKEVWLEKNGKKIYVTIDDVAFDTVQHNLYQVSVTYKVKEL